MKIERENQQVRVESPAKINWFLDVLGKRDDGYHELATLMAKVSLCDELVITKHERVDPSRKKLTCANNPSLEGDGNLIIRAAKLLEVDLGLVTFDLHKQIPVGGGVGGGSSNAAAALIGLNALFELGKGEDVLMQLGAKLGADVPFFVGNASCALATGIGTSIEPVQIDNQFQLILVYPGISVSTSWAYQAGGFLTLSKRNDTEKSIVGWRQKNLDLITRNMRNDLESVVFARYPLLREIKKQLHDQGAVAAQMSGSGACLFGLFREEQDAERALKAFAFDSGDAWAKLVRTL